MKKLLSVIFAILFCVAFSGCVSDEFVPPITVEYYEDGEMVRTMLDYESDIIMDILNSKKWTKGDILKVRYDYVLTMGEEQILYSSETGTFADAEDMRYIIADEEARTLINQSLQNSLNIEGSYPDPILTCSTSGWNGTPDLQMSDEQIEAIIAVFENGEWQEGEVDIDASYKFIYLGAKIFYSYDGGIFSDVTNGRYLVLSDEKKAEVNNNIDWFISLPIID